MKKILYIVFACLISTAVFAESYWYNATSLTGGATGSLDAINGQLLVNNDKAIVTTNSGQTYIYNLDSDSALAEDSTDYSVVSPDSNAGDKRWIMMFKGDRLIIPDSTIDQGDDSIVGTLAWHIADASGASIVVHVSAGTYKISTSVTAPSTTKIRFDQGAILKPDATKRLTANSPSHLIAGNRQQIVDTTNNAADPLTFTKGGVVYPQWWGALGDGAQDDQPYMQAAVDSIPSGTLRVLAGVYVLNTMQSYTSANTGSENGILVIENEVSIKGDGRDSSIFDVTLDDTFFGTIVINGVNGVTIEDVAITGTATAYSNNYGGGVRVLLSSRTVVRNCHFEDLRGIGINFVGNLAGPNGDTDVDHYCTYGIVDGNTLRNINSDGIYHVFSKYNSTINNILYDAGNTDAIIYEASDHSTIANNIIIEPKQRAILLNTGSSSCTVTGNTIYHYDAATVYDSIYLASVRHCTISDNTIEYATSGGTPASAIISVPGSYSYVDTYHVIANNVIKNAGGSIDVAAIHIQTDYNLIKGNNLDSGTYGISFDAADYNILRGNFIHSTGQSIRLVGIDGRDDPTYTYVTGNYITAGIFDNDTNTHWDKNIPSNLGAVAATENVLDTYSKWYSSVTLDSSAGAITLAVGSGSYVGQQITIVMTDATASSTVSITNHQTSDPEIATFDAVDETGVFMWTGTEWITLFATCTF